MTPLRPDLQKKPKRSRDCGEDIGWPDIPFNRGNYELEHVTEPRSLDSREVCNVPGFNVIYDFATDRCYSFEATGTEELGIVEAVAETLDEFEPEEL
jgi:hypothetical protein